MNRTRDSSSPPRAGQAPEAPSGHPITSEAIPETGPLTGAQCMTLCSGCVRCCMYVAVEVDAPDAPWMYDQYVWLLYHRNVWMYIETGNRWFVQFETRCDKLSDAGQCTVHGQHPGLCKEYDPRSCERRGVMSDIRARFYDGDDLVKWIESNRPTHHKRYRAWFEKQHAPKDNGQPPANSSGKAKSKPIALIRYEMPPPPVNPLLFRTPATRVAYRKVTGPDGNGTSRRRKTRTPVG